MTETEQKPTLAVYPKTYRKKLFGVLVNIIAFSEEKRVLKGNSDKVKQAWTRIAISAISAAGVLLNDVELENVEERLEILEQKLEALK